MIEEAINYLGRRGRDRVTGLEGVVEAVSFDLYGCVVVTLKPPLDEQGVPRKGFWLDISRIELLGDERVMPVPPFAPQRAGQPETYDKGAADKPPMRR